MIELLAKEIGQDIREKRIAQQMDIMELAVYSGLSQQSIYRLEGGKVNPTIKTLLQVYSALGYDLEIYGKAKKSK